MISDTREKAFQKDIWEYLISIGYIKRSTKDYDVDSCLDVDLVLDFVKSTQKEVWEVFSNRCNSTPEVEFKNSLVRAINIQGTLDVLRNGFRDFGTNFKLFYPKPNTNMNINLIEKYSQNIFSVIEELEYENKNNGNRIDLVIFINGIPISTIELKDTFSQGVEKAIKQYKEDRDSNEKLFKNCLIHFAMSDEKIYMATKLQDEKTKFLPFNKELRNPNIEGFYPTSYLYTEILQPNQLSRLINNFIFEEEGITIFPRFHQLDCVNYLLKDSKPGRNYLIQHSAGSGKTKTIAWLAHSLLSKFDENNKRVYDSIIVVSDRTVIDGQLQEQVKAIEKEEDIVQKIDKNSNQLANEILAGADIIVTTLHKFSYIVSKIKDIKDRKYAVIIDEAHSSQTGTHARNLRGGLSDGHIDEDAYFEAEDEIDKQIIQEIERSRNTQNLSFFAFTATPKQKTLQMFGRKNEYGNYIPHHIYSMKQAIKEGFILDVLNYYLTYPTYFNLIKKVDDDPEYDKDRAIMLMKRFVERHPHSIHEKTKIILDHFMSSTYKKIKDKNNKGLARAMLVTSKRKQAVLYKLEFDRQIKEKNLPIETLVAFSGSILHDGEEYTEISMNDLQNQSIKEAFKKDPYRILIVADKYQTGFDEPLLHTMYVDKKLNGVKAVQTLSRLNRTYPNKKDTLVLDFANKTSDIQEAFSDYYGETILTEATDYHTLYDLMGKLFGFYLYNQEDVDKFVKSRRSGVNQQELHNQLNEVVKKFLDKDINEQGEFKRTLRRYQNLYSFLHQLLPFPDLLLDKLFEYNSFLNKKLPTINDPLPINVLENIDMSSYKIDTGYEIESLSLNKDKGELTPVGGGTNSPRPENKEKLSEILTTINKRFGTDFTDEDSVNFFNDVENKIISDTVFINQLNNPDNSKENLKAVFEDVFNKTMFSLVTSHFKLYEAVYDENNKEFKNYLESLLFNKIYEKRESLIEE